MVEGPAATSIHGLSLQQLVVRLPIKMGGLGIRNQEQLRYAAFGGTVDQCVPQIGVSTGLCPALGQQFGGDECFGRGMPADTRWEVLISSGCRLGQEFGEVGGVLRLEASQYAELLDEELDGALAQPVRGAGMGCVTEVSGGAAGEDVE